MQDFRRFFLRGLALILPPILTVLILLYFWDLLDRKVAEPSNKVIRRITARLIQKSAVKKPVNQPDRWVGLSRDRRTKEELAPFVPREVYQLVLDKTAAAEKMPETVNSLYERYLYYEYWQPYYLKFVGLAVAVVLVYFIGHFLATFIGRNMWQATEQTVFRLPIVRAVYPYMKQFIDFLLSEQKREYNRVVAVEYPRRGIWSIGLVTGESIRDLELATGQDLLTVFVPYSPWSISGYAITLPRTEVLDLNLTVDEAIRFVVSGGIIRPTGTRMREIAGGLKQARELPSEPIPSVHQRPVGPRTDRAIRVGARGSQLARAQAEWVIARLREQVPGREIEFVEIRTGGDNAANARLRDLGGEGIFTKEIQSALLADEIDLAVHSLKDLPTQEVPGLMLGAIPHRVPALDVLVAPQFGDWRSLPQGARIGTSSPRRRGQLLRLRPDLVIEEIRGNVPTRLKRIEEQGLAGVVLAHAGLHRLGLEQHITYRFSADEMLPAPGQGALGLECRVGDVEIIELLKSLDDAVTRAAALAERAVLAGLRGGCHMPMGAYAVVAQGQLGLRAAVFSLDGTRALTDSMVGSSLQAESLGKQLADRLLAAGADKLA